MWEEMRLDLLGNFQFLGGATLGFLFFCDGAAFCFDGASDLIKADEGVGVAVRILETRKDSTPDRGSIGGGRFLGPRRVNLSAIFKVAQTRVDVKNNAAPAPFAKFQEDILGDEGDLGVAADEFCLFGGGVGSDEAEI